MEEPPDGPPIDSSSRTAEPLHSARVPRARTSTGERIHNPYTKLFEERIIFLGVQIDDASADDVMAQLLTPGVDGPERDIQIYINSPGGSFTAMTAIYDTMQFVKPQVGPCAWVKAASAAAVLLAAGAPGKRSSFALPHARILIHQPYTEGWGSGAPTSRSRRTRSCVCVPKWRNPFPSHRPYGGADPEGHRARQDPHRRSGQGVRRGRPGDQFPQDRHLIAVLPNASGKCAHAARQANSRGTVETGTRCQYPRKGQLVARIGEGRTC